MQQKNRISVGFRTLEFCIQLTHDIMQQKNRISVGFKTY